MADWANEYFERGYAQRWGLPPVTDQVRFEAEGMWVRCGLSPGARVVDLGCGHGRHALALAARGARVVGVDAASSLIKYASRLGRELEVSADWVRGDMRRVPVRSHTCHAAVMMDAFGFFESEEDNALVLREAARVLRPRGALAVKLVNGAPILADFRGADREERDGVVVMVSRTLSLAPPRMTEQLSVSGPRGSGHYERRQRLYRAAEVTAMLRTAGFDDITIAADTGGGSFDPAGSPTMWVTARRGHP